MAAQGTAGNGMAFPNEIFTSIFEELAAAGSLPFAWRLVSRRVNEILLPVLFREFAPGPVVLNRTMAQQVRDYIGPHTRHLRLRGNRSPDYCFHLVNSLHFLRELTITSSPISSPTPINGALALMNRWPQLMVNLLQADMNELQIYGIMPFNIRRLETVDWTPMPSYLGSEFKQQCTSLSLATAQARLGHGRATRAGMTTLSRQQKTQTGGYASVKDVLLANPQMEVLHLCSPLTPNRQWFDDSTLEDRDFFPTLRELKLVNYDWDHWSHEAINLWDWSRLERLELRGVFISDFLSTVPPAELISLKSFSTDSHCEREVQRSGAAIWLCELVEKLDHSLEDLEFSISHYGGDMAKEIPKHTDLKSLTFEDFETVENDRTVPYRATRSTLEAHQLRAIAIGCPHMTDLKLVLNLSVKRWHDAQNPMVPGRNPSTSPYTMPPALRAWFQTINRSFRNLRRIGLDVREITPMPMPVSADSMTVDAQGPVNIVNALVSGKRGVPFERIFIVHRKWYNTTYEEIQGEPDRTARGQVICYEYEELYGQNGKQESLNLWQNAVNGKVSGF